MTIRILLADDHRVMRQGLKSLLEEEPDFEVVAAAGDGRTAVELAEKWRPDVALLDISMPDLNGVEAARRITEVSPRTYVVALSMHSDRQHVTNMLEAGASGYVLKDCEFGELAAAVRVVAEGEVYLTPRVSNVVLETYVRGRHTQEAPQLPQLTPREREVLQLIAEGHTTKEIAGVLGVSVKTIETHRANTMRKLDVRSVAELTKAAIREGLTSVED
jgi:DNA-binding NarL/FixJ family response regulator